MEFNHSTETISPDDTVPVITIGGTGGIKIPAGDTSTRPISQGEGVLRLNTTGTGVLEYNDNADNWTEIASVEYVNNETGAAVTNAMAEIGTITWDMTGFPDRTAHSTLAIDESTRTVTVTPVGASMDIYHRGVRYEISTPLSIVFNDTYGGHYICFDPTTQQLIDVGAQASIREDVLAAYVFWDDVNNKAIIFGDERHGSSRDVEWHYAQHRNVGSVWRSGGGINYDLNASALVSFSLGNTTIADEDLEHFIVDSSTPTNPYEQTLSPAANVPVLHLSGASSKYVQSAPSTLPWLPNGSNGTYYNYWDGDEWILDNVPEGQYVVYWLIATNDIYNPIKLVLGREVHPTVDDAVSEQFEAYNLPLAECVPLYQFTLQYSSAYNLNSCRVQIVAVRAISSRETVASDAFVAENHGNLTGRNAADQHPISAITDLQTTLDGKLPFVNLTVTTAAATATKTTTEAVTFTDGVLYNVLFTLGNSVSTPTINGVGIRLGTTAASTVTFTIGSGVVVPMLYNASSNTLQLMGSYRTADAVESYRMAWDVVATAGATTTRYKFLMQALDGKYYPITIGDSAVDVEKSISSQQFVIGSPIIYYSGATTVNANAQYASATLFSEVTVSTFAYTANQLSGWTPYANVYLVGNVDAAGLFTLDTASPTSFMTQTLPTVEDGKVYVLLGHMGNSASGSQFRLFLHNQAFIFKNGSLQLYSSRDSYVTSDTDQTITGVKTFDSDVTFGFATFGDIEVTDTITSASLLSFATATGETVNATVGITTPALQVTGGAPGSGKVLTSDATGNATWQTPTSGVTSMADGTVAAPGWAFANEIDVGLHRPAAGSLSIVSNNGEQVRVSGVTNAVNYVTLSGNTAGSGPVIGVDGASTNIDLYFRTKGNGAVYAMNASDGLIYGVFNGAGATASTQYLTFTNAATGSIPYVQSNGTDATVPIRYLSKSATGYHQFSTTTNNDILTLQSVTSGVNNLTITNAVSASSPTISATGSATNININLTPKGSGGVNLTSGPLLIAGASGTSGQVLTSNGAGAPSWQSVNVTVGSTAGVPIITTTGGALSAGSFGTIAGTFCQGNDSRLSDARTPLSHTHGNITNAGTIGSTSGLPIITTTSGVLTTGTFGTTSGTFCQGNDSRLNDTRNTTNAMTLRFGGGTTEGTDQYTFNGSAAKTINFVAGANISLTESAGQVTIAATSGGGTPGGSTGQMQYNNAGAFAGSANVLIENDNLKLMPLASIPTAPTDGLVMFDRIRGGRHLPSIIGPSGVDVALQPALFGNSVYMWLPGTGTTLGINWGTSFTARNSGTGAVQNHPTKTSTNAMTSMNRATFGTGTNTSGASGIQSTSTVAWRGNAAGLGGFFFFAQFGIETLATGQRAFVGLSANNATMAADPSSWNNTCGIGKDSGDTTWQIIMCGTSATKTNTGITVTAGQILDFAMFAAPNDSSITCRVANAVTGAVLYDNTSFTTNLPTNTTFLYMQAHTQSTSGTTAKLFALNRMYVETDL